MSYAELHCHSNFSFLEGVADPEDLVNEAAHLNLAALALTDRDGVYGVVRGARAARAAGLPMAFGAEITIGAHSLVVIADGARGYARLARTLSLGHLAGSKGAPVFTISDLVEGLAGDAWVLTGCGRGMVPTALMKEGPRAARSRLEQLVAGFGRDRVLMELWDHGDPVDSARNDALVAVAAHVGVESVA